MTKEGRLARGKDNHERKRFLDNPETLEWTATIQEEKPKEDVEEDVEEKPKSKGKK